MQKKTLPSDAAKKTMKIKGTVNSIIFCNKDNGYTVLDLIVKKNKEPITCVGNLPSVSEGECLELAGEFTRHSKFGEQFVVSECAVAEPESAAGIERYLASGVIKGIGPATAKEIVKVFGEDSLDVIENQPELLVAVRGVSKRKALEIGESYSSIKEMKEQIMFLQSFNMTLNLAVRIYNIYKEKTSERLKENPYVLIDDVDGVGFITADKIARNMGYSPTGEFRIRAGIIYVLRENSEKNGNTYMSESELSEKTFSLLEIDPEENKAVYDRVMQILELELTIRRFSLSEENCVALYSCYNTEKSIAAKLIRLKRSAPSPQNDDDLIRNYERINGITLHPLQRQAVLDAVNSGVSVITGGPGTGKTTIIKCICHIFHARGIDPVCLTPTGRAAKRMQQATGEDAKTIHRALEFQYRSGPYFGRNEDSPLDGKVFIVDEVSMTDIFVFNALLKAVKDGSVLILVGDKDQLPSVGAGSVLADIISSGLIKVSFLKHIYRQEDGSLIISNAHLINACEMPVINNKSTDFFFLNRETPEEIASTVVELTAERLPKFHGKNPTEIQVLAPMKAGPAGVANINARLQATLNPPSREKGEIRYGGTVFRLGDKVMQTANDYQAEWVKIAENGSIESGEGVYNGDIGFVSEVEGAGLSVTFEDGRIVEYQRNSLQDLTLAYCVTVHKSQGSEFDVAVIVITSGPPSIINKNLLYTAVTRAKKSVVLVGNRRHLYGMVKNNFIVLRNTLLKLFLPEEEKRYETYFSDGKTTETKSDAQPTEVNNGDIQ